MFKDGPLSNVGEIAFEGKPGEFDAELKTGVGKRYLLTPVGMTTASIIWTSGSVRGKFTIIVAG
jgi:hypothetical protein